MSTVFYTSDAHIGHVKIARIRAEQFVPHINFANDAEVVAWHDNELAARWDAVVTDSDVVWVVGDISSGTNSKQHAALEWFSRRRGIKRLVAGNHDGVHPHNRDFYKWDDAYRAVFQTVTPFARQKVNGVDVMISHFPYEGDHVEVQRYTEYRLRDEGMPLIHGHTHSMSVGDSRVIHVGVDARNMAPVSVADIAEQMAC